MKNALRDMADQANVSMGEVVRDALATHLGVPARTFEPEPELAPDEPSAIELLNDPDVFTISVKKAAEAIGVSRSTMAVAYRETGFIMEGVPVIYIGKRVMVPTRPLRQALGIKHPD